METARCPHCEANLPEKEVAAGWCESCGKRIPTAVLARVRAKDPQEEGRRTKGDFFTGARWLLLLFGLAALYLGYSEWRVAHGTQMTPSEVDLAALEAGAPVPQNHIRIGKHIRLYPATVYVVKGRSARQKDAKVEYCFYPIISTTNPLFDRLADFEKAREKEDRTAAIPQVKNLKVLVKTKLFDQVSAIPEQATVEEAISGLVINRIDSLTRAEADLIREQFPLIDPDQLLILEAGRAPTSSGYALGCIGIGGLLLVPVFLPALRRLFERFTRSGPA